MILYHFTSKYHLDSISQDGFLKTTESNIEADGTGGPPVVWLTSSKNPDRQKWKRGSAVNKTEVVFPIDTNKLDQSKLWPWRVFSKKHGISTKWYKALSKGGGDPKEWWVYEDIIVLTDSLADDEG